MAHIRLPPISDDLRLHRVPSVGFRQESGGLHCGPKGHTVESVEEDLYQRELQCECPSADHRESLKVHRIAILQLDQWLRWNHPRSLCIFGWSSFRKPSS